MTNVNTQFAPVYDMPVHARQSAQRDSRYKVYTARNLSQIKALESIDPQIRFEMQVVASVLPFRVNQYLIDQVIQWDQVPEDPIFRLTFPQRDMLDPADYEAMALLHKQGASRQQIAALAHKIRLKLNPHPAGQLEMNRPRDQDDEPLNGLQHKYRETVLFFPKAGQTCHSYCTFCFRWAQFVGDTDLRMATDHQVLHDYLRHHHEATDLLMTGGDPMIMRTRRLKQYLEPLLMPEFDHIKTIRIGTKALSFWPYRFVSDNDADELIELLTRLSAHGKHVAIMAHYNHGQELSTQIAQDAIQRVRATGAEIRSQGPLLAHINDDPDVWAKMWQQQVNLGIIPYYFFVERETGAKRYFEVPLARAWEIYREAMQKVSGVGRTARGPSMSAGPGKVEIQGVAEIHGEKCFVLRFIQGRNSDWVQRPFFAKYDPKATWLDQLKPAFGESSFFFEDEYQAMCAQAAPLPIAEKKLV